MLKYLHENGTHVQDYDDYSLSRAMWSGDTKMSDYLIKVGATRDYLMTTAAASGYITMVDLVRANGIEWDEEACTAAALRGHLDVQKHLHANGCPWNKADCLRSPVESVIEWIHENSG